MFVSDDPDASPLTSKDPRPIDVAPNARAGVLEAVVAATAAFVGVQERPTSPALSALRDLRNALSGRPIQFRWLNEDDDDRESVPGCALLTLQQGLHSFVGQPWSPVATVEFAVGTLGDSYEVAVVIARNKILDNLPARLPLRMWAPPDSRLPPTSVLLGLADLRVDESVDVEGWANAVERSHPRMCQTVLVALMGIMLPIFAKESPHFSIIYCHSLLQVERWLYGDPDTEVNRDLVNVEYGYCPAWAIEEPERATEALRMALHSAIFAVALDLAGRLERSGGAGKLAMRLRPRAWSRVLGSIRCALRTWARIAS